MKVTTPTVLITRFSAIGDVALTIPFVYSYCRSNLGMHFLMVTRKPLQNIFINTPANLTVIGIDTTADYKGLCGMRRLLRELRKDYNIKAYADLHDVIRTKYLRKLTSLSLISTAHIRKGRFGKWRLTRKHNKKLHELIPTIERYERVFKRLGIFSRPGFDYIFGPDGAPDSACPEIARRGNGDDGLKWIGIAPFARHKGKIYPPELMEKVLEILSQQPDVRLFLFGGGDRETEQLGQWASRFPNTVSLASARLGFAAEMALMSRLDVMLTMDSANLHLATISGPAGIVSVWGATHPYCGFGGWKDFLHSQVQADLPCRPCSVFGNKPCRFGDYRCLRAIPPEEIAAKVLAATRHTPAKYDEE